MSVRTLSFEGAQSPATAEEHASGELAQSKSELGEMLPSVQLSPSSFSALAQDGSYQVTPKAAAHPPVAMDGYSVARPPVAAAAAVRRPVTPVEGRPQDEEESLGMAKKSKKTGKKKGALLRWISKNGRTIRAAFR